MTYKIGFFKWRSGRNWHEKMLVWLSFIRYFTYARIPHFRALSLPVILSLALM